jgi:transcriptional regulator with XRE-family HTH domain
MDGGVLKTARTAAGWTQSRLAEKLGVTQAYLSLMESGGRRVPTEVARRVARLFDLPATALPFETSSTPKRLPTNEWVEGQLARLGYPGYAYRKRPGAVHHPVEVLVTGLSLDELDPRVAEALPWLLLRYAGLDERKLADAAKLKDLQNRLGFVVALARQVAERNEAFRSRLTDLRRLEDALEASRLVREETFGQPRASGRLRAWLREKRSATAKHWNLLSDLQVEHLPYVA